MKNPTYSIATLFLFLGMQAAQSQDSIDNKCIVEISSKKPLPPPALMKIFENKGYQIKVKEGESFSEFSKNLKKWGSVSTLSEEELGTLEDQYMLLSISNFKPICRVETTSFSFMSSSSSKSKYNCSFLQVMFSSVQDKKVVRILPIAKSYMNDKKASFESEEQALADVYKKLDADLLACSKIRSVNNLKKVVSGLEVKTPNPNEINEAKQATEVNDSAAEKIIDNVPAKESNDVSVDIQK
jgi:hypothetical protein